MRKHKIKGILILLTVIMIVGTISTPAIAKELDSIKEEKTDLEKKKKEIDERISALEKEKSDIINYIEKLDYESNRLSEEIYSLTLEIDLEEEKLEEAKEELHQARLLEKAQYDIMKKRIRYIYENGETSFLEILLESKSIAEFLNEVEIRSKITEYDNNLLGEYKKVKELVYEKELALEEKIANLTAMKEELSYEQEAVERLVDKKNQELEKHEADISSAEHLSGEYGSQLQDKIKEIDRIEEEERQKAIEKRRQEEERRKEEERKRKEEERKKEEQARGDTGSKPGNNQGNDQGNNQGNPSDGSGNDGGSPSQDTGFIWPVPSSRRITSYFGKREQPTAGASTYHNGIDIGAPNGSDIVSSASGQVIRAGYSPSAGYNIEVDHGGGIHTRYLHCSTLIASTGDYVQKGQLIARVGSTGISTGPHLHFETIVNGVKVNPLKYVN